MSKENRDKENKPEGVKGDEMDGGPVGGSLNTDNAFSDRGLENASLLHETLKGNK
ncbi:hypothetical protein [Mesobacillus foraminis]|uniref:hypothetical protein n=1 Tax=Mesobacillus foraminis TaxID=279826 RepID=UPI0013CEF446|nr:hypothetical protein [Mesobacillus foraminis]